MPSIQCVMSMKAALVKLFMLLPRNDKNITRYDKYLIIRHDLKSKEVGSSNGAFEKYQANLNMVYVEAAERSLEVGM